MRQQRLTARAAHGEQDAEHCADHGTERHHHNHRRNRPPNHTGDKYKPANGGDFKIARSSNSQYTADSWHMALGSEGAAAQGFESHDLTQRATNDAEFSIGELRTHLIVPHAVATAGQG